MITARPGSLASLVLLAACGGTTPAPSAPPPATESPPASTPQIPDWSALESGKACAKAQSRCGGGVCDVRVKNDCDAPVHCDLAISATCQGGEGGGSVASGGDRGTIGAHESGEIDAQASCTSGPIVHTEVQQLLCR